VVAALAVVAAVAGGAGDIQLGLAAPMKNPLNLITPRTIKAHSQTGRNFH
jgi:hypothetical protein